MDDVETNIRRVQARAAQGGHWIEPETIRRRVLGSLDNLPSAIAVAGLAVLLDNSGTAHRQVLKVEHGVIVDLAPYPPPWLAGQLPRIAAELERAARQIRRSIGT